MADKKREEDAVDAYVKFLHGKGIGKEVIAQRSKFLKKLTIFLKGKSTKSEFGIALQTVLGFDNNSERHHLLNIAREFFPFWMSEIKLIAAMSESYGYDLSKINFKPLPELLNWPTIDELAAGKFKTYELLLLYRYKEIQQKQKVAENEIDAKLKLVKILLLRLRDLTVKNNLAYRMAVDVTLPLFVTSEIKKLFVQIVREFFYLWIETPDDEAN